MLSLSHAPDLTSDNFMFEDIETCLAIKLEMMGSIGRNSFSNIESRGSGRYNPV